MPSSDMWDMPEWYREDGTLMVWDPTSHSYVAGPDHGGDMAVDRGHASGGDNDLFDPTRDNDFSGESNQFQSGGNPDNNGWLDGKTAAGVPPWFRELEPGDEIVYGTETGIGGDQWAIYAVQHIFADGEQWIAEDRQGNQFMVSPDGSVWTGGYDPDDGWTCVGQVIDGGYYPDDEPGDLTLPEHWSKIATANWNPSWIRIVMHDHKADEDEVEHELGQAWQEGFQYQYPVDPYTDDIVYVVARQPVEDPQAFYEWWDQESDAGDEMISGSDLSPGAPPLTEFASYFFDPEAFVTFNAGHPDAEQYKVDLGGLTGQIGDQLGQSQPEPQSDFEDYEMPEDYICNNFTPYEDQPRWCQNCGRVDHVHPNFKTSMALRPEQWSEILQETPYFYHVTEPNRLPAIKQHGLVPGSEVSDKTEGVWTEMGGIPARQGFIYLWADKDGAEHGADWFLGIQNPTILTIDASKLDPNLLEADEDYPSSDPHEFVQQHGGPTPEEYYGDTDTYDQGNWSGYDPWDIAAEAGSNWSVEHPMLGDPDVTYQSWKGFGDRQDFHGRLAYGGPIPPDAIVNIEGGFGPHASKTAEVVEIAPAIPDLNYVLEDNPEDQSDYGWVGWFTTDELGHNHKCDDCYGQGTWYDCQNFLLEVAEGDPKGTAAVLNATPNQPFEWHTQDPKHGHVRLLIFRDREHTGRVAEVAITPAMPDLNYVLDYNPEDQQETGWYARIWSPNYPSGANNWIGGRSDKQYKDIHPTGIWDESFGTWQQCADFLREKWQYQPLLERLAVAPPDEPFEFEWNGEPNKNLRTISFMFPVVAQISPLESKTSKVAMPYHVSPRKNREKILREGLKPADYAQLGELYYWDEPEQAERYGEEYIGPQEVRQSDLPMGQRQPSNGYDIWHFDLTPEEEQQAQEDPFFDGIEPWDEDFRHYFNYDNTPGAHYIPNEPHITPDRLRRVSMAERTGDPELDAALAEFAQGEMFGYVGGEKWPVEAMRDRDNADGMCSHLADQLESFLKAKGFDAYRTPESNQFYNESETDDWELEMEQAGEGKPWWQPDPTPDDLGYSDRQIDNGYDHHLVIVQTSSGVFSVDFTAAQFGYSEFPLVQRLDENTWNRDF